MKTLKTLVAAIAIASAASLFVALPVAKAAHGPVFEGSQTSSYLNGGSWSPNGYSQVGAFYDRVEAPLFALSYLNGGNWSPDGFSQFDSLSVPRAVVLLGFPSYLNGGNWSPDGVTTLR